MRIPPDKRGKKRNKPYLTPQQFDLLVELIPEPYASMVYVAIAAEAEQHLQELEGKWKAYPSVSQVWRRNWARITPFFNYPPDIRGLGDPHQRGISLSRRSSAALQEIALHSGPEQRPQP
jgi:hypothetical protein